MPGTGASALEPWRNWYESRGKRKLVHSAALAANAHNTQPWRFHVAQDKISVCADTDRHIGSFDPFRREMHLSLGCALENIDQAARAQGLETHMEFPPGTLSLAAAPSDPAAIVHLRPGNTDESELFRAIPRRHTHRGAYDAHREVPDEVLAGLGAAALDCHMLRLYLVTGAAMKPLASLITSSTRAIIDDPDMSRDNARWFRFRQKAIDECRDGLTLDTNVTKPLKRFFAKLFPPSAARADRHWGKDTTRIHLATAPLLGMIAVRSLYDRPTSLHAGRLWQRLHLLLTARDLAAQPLNQPVERVDRERQLEQPAHTAEALARITGDPEWQPTFIFRAGYPLRAPLASPRRPIDAVISR